MMFTDSINKMVLRNVYTLQSISDNMSILCILSLSSNNLHIESGKMFNIQSMERICGECKFGIAWMKCFVFCRG